MLKRLAKSMLGRRPSAADDFPPVDMNAIWNAAPVDPAGKKLVFAFTVGRSGMRWFAKLCQAHANCRAHSERFPFHETFFRYATWHDLPVDLTGFYALLRQSIHYDWARAEISYNASPFYHAGAGKLLDNFPVSLAVLNLRRPEAVVNSFYSMGWYQDPLYYEDMDKAPGLQGDLRSFHHHFARVLPRGEFFEEFRSMTRIGRIAWFCSRALSMIDDQLSTHPELDRWNLRLEDIDQNYEFYLQAAGALGLAPRLGKKEYLATKGTMGNRLGRKRTSADWSSREKKEYEAMIGPYVEIYDRARLPRL